jgi:putative heme iron utilization protein
MNDMQAAVQDAQKKTKPLAPKIEELLAQSQSVILATVDAAGSPNASYAPFARIGNQFYILVSFMARHTRNLKDIGKVSAMFIEDETATKQMYARDRLTLDVASAEVERSSEKWGAAVVALKEKHGKVLDMLVEMNDFIMIELTPVKGAYVNGFGSAYFVDENLEVMQHRNDMAHGVRPEADQHK